MYVAAGLLAATALGVWLVLRLDPPANDSVVTAPEPASVADALRMRLPRGANTCAANLRRPLHVAAPSLADPFQIESATRSA